MIEIAAGHVFSRGGECFLISWILWIKNFCKRKPLRNLQFLKEKKISTNAVKLAAVKYLTYHRRISEDVLSLLTLTKTALLTQFWSWLQASVRGIYLHKNSRIGLVKVPISARNRVNSNNKSGWKPHDPQNKRSCVMTSKWRHEGSVNHGQDYPNR